MSLIPGMDFPNLVKVIGIGIDAPKFTGDMNAEDFIVLPCDIWTDAMRAHYEAENEPWSFFETPQLQRFKERVAEFVPSTSAAASPVRTATVGRNEPCPLRIGEEV